MHAITARFGFMETPDVAEALKACRARGLRVFTEDSSFFVGRHVVRARRCRACGGCSGACSRACSSTARRRRSSSACRSGSGDAEYRCGDLSPV